MASTLVIPPCPTISGGGLNVWQEKKEKVEVELSFSASDFPLTQAPFSKDKNISFLLGFSMLLPIIISGRFTDTYISLSF